MVLIEPIPEIFAAMQVNSGTVSALGHDVHLLQSAVGNPVQENETTDVYFYARAPGESTRHPAEQQHQARITQEAAASLPSHGPEQGMSTSAVAVTAGAGCRCARCRMYM